MAPKKKLSRKNDEFEVERIVGDKYVGGQRFFFIKWKNFPTSQNTWEPEENLSKCSFLIREYFNGKGLRNSKSHSLSTALLRSLRVSKQRRSSISSLISISSAKSPRKLIVCIEPVNINVRPDGSKQNARNPTSSDSPRVELVRINLPDAMPKVLLESSDDVEKSEYSLEGKGNEYRSPERTRLSDTSNMSLSIQLSDESANEHLPEDSGRNDVSPKCLELTVALSRVSSPVSVDSKLVEASNDPAETVSCVPDADESSSKENNESETGDKTEQNSVPTTSNIDPDQRPSTSAQIEPNAKITVRLFDQTPRPVFSASLVLENADEIEDSDEDLLSMRVFEGGNDAEVTAEKPKNRKRKRY